MTDGREHDIVLFGATGFTGALTAEYLAANAPDTTRWALAGRNRDKLERLRERLGADVPLLHADCSDPSSLREAAASTRVFATTVGPYIKQGAPIVAACAAEGTDYADITGEPEFVDNMYVRHHARAAETGARLVHACGFDSIPHDLGAQFTVEQLPEDVPLTVRGFVRAGGRPSAGTFHSALEIMGRARQGQKAYAERKRREPQQPEGRRVTLEKPAPRHEPPLGWALPMPTIDPVIIKRSAVALDRYGPDFTYGHYVAVKHLPVAVGVAGGAATMFTLAQVPPVRRFLQGRMSSGEGPSPERRERSWFKVRFVGEGGGKSVTTEVAGGDPGYGETSKMLAETALSLAHDNLPQTAGQVTTAQALGPVLRERLDRAGITFTVL